MSCGLGLLGFLNVSQEHEFYRELANSVDLSAASQTANGWITIWRGWEKLNNLVQGAKIASQFQNNICG